MPHYLTHVRPHLRPSPVGNNRSGVGMALSSLITQVRKKVHEAVKNGESAMQQFRKFDTDHR